MQELIKRNVKKVGAVKVSEYVSGAVEIDYDSIMEHYLEIIKKEKEAFEAEKTLRHKSVMLWSRAIKTEEKKAIEKFAAEHGEEEMQAIREAIKQRHEREF